MVDPDSISLDSSSIIKLVVIFILIVLSAFFSSAETAFSTANKIRIQSLADEGNKRAKKALNIISNYRKMLSTVLIGNNIVNIVASSLVTVFATELFGDFAIGIATGVLTVVILLFGEIVPKTWAKLNSERVVLFYAGIIGMLCVIFTPLVFIVDILSNTILKILRMDPNKKVVSITESELLTYVDVSHEEGVIESEEKEMIYNLFDFSDAYAKDVMIPRPDIVEVDVDASYEEVKEIFKENMYTRIPVYDDTPEKIIGVINIKDFLFIENNDKFKIRDIMRDVYYTYEYKKTADLFKEMRRDTITLAIVLNEYGAAEGMITIEDLLEEIVGDIKDEYDEDERETIRQVGEREYLVEGSMKLDDINDKISTEFISENYDSIGGFIIEHLDDNIPKEGEQVTLEDGTVLKVEQFSENRITLVRMCIAEKKVEDDENEDTAEI